MNSFFERRFSSGFIENNSERIYYESYGEGPAIVFTHGFGGNHSVWYQQVPTFAAHYRVVTWDQRGFGKSSNQTGRASPNASVSDLEILIDHLGINKVTLIGQSLGGWTALGFAFRHPKRVDKLILGDTIAGIYTPRIEKAFDEFIDRAMTIPSDLRNIVGQHPGLGDKFCRENPEHAFLYKQIGELSGSPPGNLLPLYRKTSFSPQVLNRSGVPILFVSGEKDPIFPPEIIKEASSILSNSRASIMPETGHSPYFEDASKWNEIVFDFVNFV